MNWLPLTVFLAAALIVVPGIAARAAAPYQVYVTNERSGDVTVINGADLASRRLFRWESGREVFT